MRGKTAHPRGETDTDVHKLSAWQPVMSRKGRWQWDVLAKLRFGPGSASNQVCDF